MKIKKLTALVMAFTVTCGVTQAVNNYSPVSFTASAEEQISEAVSFDEETGTLTLRGDIYYSDVQEYKGKAKTVIAEEGTVLPEYCSELFSGFKNATKIDLSKADASKVKYMTHMFRSCSNMTYINLAGLDTSNVVLMNGVFEGCDSLISIDLSSFDTSKAETMYGMFYMCYHLQSLDLSNFNTVNVSIMKDMFGGCSELKTVYVGSKWVTDGVIDDSHMFEDCNALTGGNGTKYDEKNISIEYAHVDEPDNPGYFSVREGGSYETPAELKSTIVKDGALTYRVFEDHAEVRKCDEKAEGDIVIADKVDGKPVTKIAVDAFLLCKVSSVVMPDTVKEIGTAAFNSCSISENFKISKNLERIGVEAFNLASIPSLELAVSSDDMELAAFSNSNFEKIVLSDNVEKIKNGLFYNSAIRELTILNPDCDIYDSEKTFGSVHTIIGHRGSTADAYAKKYGILFYALEDKPVVYGDANDDGTVDMSDVVLIMQSLANPNKYGINGTDENHITDFGLKNADVSRGENNAPNGVTNDDALLIQKYLLGQVSTLEVKMP